MKNLYGATLIFVKAHFGYVKARANLQYLRGFFLWLHSVICIPGRENLRVCDRLNLGVIAYWFIKMLCLPAASCIL